MILVPVVFWLLVTNQMTAAFLVFVVAGISDAVDGFLAKPFSGEDLAQTVRSIYNGEVYITPSLATRLLTNESLGVYRGHHLQLDSLTEREMQILRLIAKGMINKQIGAELTLSEKTVKHYVTNILQKLQVSNRVEAALIAQRDLIQPGFAAQWTGEMIFEAAKLGAPSEATIAAAISGIQAQGGTAILDGATGKLGRALPCHTLDRACRIAEDAPLEGPQGDGDHEPDKEDGKPTEPRASCPRARNEQRNRRSKQCRCEQRSPTGRPHHGKPCITQCSQRVGQEGRCHGRTNLPYGPGGGEGGAKSVGNPLGT